MKMKTLGICAGLIVLATRTLFAAADDNAWIEKTMTAMDLPYYTGEVFPRPRGAVYEDEFIPMETVTIVPGDELDADDALIRLLLSGLNGWTGGDGAATVATVPPEQGTVVYLNMADKGRPAPGKAEGYSISCERSGNLHVVAIQGRDRLGLLWGIVSMLQLIDRRDNTVALRRAEILDWPGHAQRGCITQAFDDGNEIAMLFTKANTLIFKFPPSHGVPPWEASGPQKIMSEMKRLSSLFTELGLNVYFRINPTAGDSGFSAASEKDVTMLVDWFKQVAALDAGVFWMYGVGATPLTDKDRERFGSAAEADAYLAPKVFRAVRESYPDFQMVFFPVHFWGPNPRHSDPEARDTYLTRIGEAFDPEIGIFWAGPSRQTTRITEADTAWFTSLAGRRPWLYQTRGYYQPAHRFDRGYVTDRITAWNDLRYDGFWNDMQASMLLVNAGRSMMALASFADYLWNPADYDAEKSARAAVGLYYGAEAFPLFDDVNRRLSYFDRFTDMTPGTPITPATAAKSREIEAEWARTEEAWERLLNDAPYPEAIFRFNVLEDSYQWTERFVKQGLTRASGEGFARFEQWDESVRETAAAEAGLGEGDKLLTPSHFSGATGYRIYGDDCEPRFAAWIRGRQSFYHTMQARFEFDASESDTEHELILSGQEDAMEPDASFLIRITFNDTILHEGPAGFPRQGWGRRRLLVPASAMRRTNTLTIENLSPGVTWMPWFMLNYAIVR